MTTEIAPLPKKTSRYLTNERGRAIKSELDDLRAELTHLRAIAELAFDAQAQFEALGRVRQSTMLGIRDAQRALRVTEARRLGELNAR